MMEGKNVESQERESKPLATIYVVRHGESIYREQEENPETEIDLTETGVKQVEALAERIRDKLTAGEKVYIMKSPRVRAQNTAKILEGALSAADHEIVELGGARPSLDKLNDVDEQGQGVKYKKGEKEKYLAEIAEILKRKRKIQHYYRKLRGGEVEANNLVSEPIEGYREKVSTVLRRLIEIARKAGGDNKKLILATHSEWLDTILEQYFGKKIDGNEVQASPASEIELQIFSDKIVLNYKGEIVVVNNKA